MSYNIVLLGNPNSGKTSVFNILTKTFQSVGNRIGVTVSAKEGAYAREKSIKIVDLPGIYALDGKCEEEKIVLDYFKNNKVDRIINVIDGTNLERSLYLTAEISRLNVPTVLAINMIDALKKQGAIINETELEKVFSQKVIQISAKKNYNVNDLISLAVGLKTPPKPFEALKDNTYYQNRSIKINELAKKTITIKNKKETLSFLDKIFMHGFWGFVVFGAILFSSYYLSSKVGGCFSSKISNLFANLSKLIKYKMINSGQTIWFTDLIASAVIKGVGSVLAFLPQVLVLYLCLTILEESGYTSRVAFLTDKLFTKFGLGGKSLISLTLSMGCTVTGITSTRTIDGESERRLAIMLCPFMPCGAKTAVFGWMSYVFFNGNPLVSLSLYFLGLFSAVIFGALLKRFKPFGYKSDPFLLEIPNLKIPSIKNVLLVLIEKMKEFLLKAGSIIFAVTVVVWFLRGFGFTGYVGENSKKSFLYLFGDRIKFLFVPLGFGSRETAVSVLCGLLAKEAVVETLEILSTDYTMLFNNSFSVYAFMAFVLLSPPCISSLIVAKHELASKKWFLFMLAFEFAVAYIVSFVINLIGVILVGSKSLLFLIIVGIILLLAILSIKKLTSGKGCKNCAFCKRGNGLCHKK